MGMVPALMVCRVYLLPTTMGRWRYMVGATSYGLVYPCVWQYYMSFVCMFGFGFQSASLAL